jgi:hypothetical protein
MDRHHPEDSNALWRSRAGPLVDTFRGGSIDRVLQASHSGPGAVCPGNRLPCIGDHRPGTGTGGPARTAWLNQTKNGTPRGVPLNVDAVQVLREQLGKHPRFAFTHRDEPILWEPTNSGWHSALERAGIKDFRFFDLRHTCASWHRQAGTSATKSRTWAAGSRGRWSTAMPSLRPRTCGLRRLGWRGV